LLNKPQRGEPEARAVTKTQQKEMAAARAFGVGGTRHGGKMRTIKGLKLNPAFWMRAALCLAVCMFGLSLAAMAKGPTYITFDVPGAAPGCCQGTQPYAISVTGAVVGKYITADNVSHGFLRTPGGAIVKFDAPGAGTESGQGTFVYSINLEGTIVGEYYDEQWGDHGFIRSPSGTITPYDVPNSQATWLSAINDLGIIAGGYWDSNGVADALLRMPGGKVTSFDAPGVGVWITFIDLGTGLSPLGEVSGAFIDQNGVEHSFVRLPTGALTAFDVPGSTSNEASSVNLLGTVVGDYTDDNTSFTHGFVRDVFGHIKTWDAPLAGPPYGTRTMANAPNGAFVGFYDDITANGYAKAFVHSPNGVTTTLLPPLGVASVAYGINPSGLVTGWYSDGNTIHGFVWIP